MQTTSQVWKDLFAAGAALEARANVVTAPGISTLFTGIAPVIRRAAMQGSLGIGNVVSASLSLVVRNAVNIPRSAKVTVQARLKDGQTASEWLPQGTFYISRRARDPVTGLLALECYDALLKANALWEPSAGTWPRTMAAVAAELAALLELSIDSRTTLPEGAAFVISEPPAGTTVRDVLGVIAQAGGGNWIVTPENRLRLLPVGGGTDAVDVTGVTGGMRAGAAGTVTGVRCTVDGLQTLIGDDTGIVVDATVAPVIAADMAEGLIGQAYQPFSLTGAIYDPAAELGDAVRAGVNGEVASVLYSETAALGPAFRGDIEAPEAGEIADEYPYIGSGEKVLALAKAAVNEAVDRLDDDLTQQEIFNRLTDNGAAQGLVLYNGQLYVNASYIRTGTLIANLIKAGVLGDVAGKNYWNMETGDFSLSATTTVGGSTVEDIAQGEAEQAVEDFDDTLTQQDVFNRLTNNGAAQGLVLYNGQLYINASYIQSGTLVLGGLNNQNGTLRVLNAAGQEIGTWTKDGISIRRGDINLDSTGSIKVGFNAADTKYVLFDNNGMQLVLDNGSKVYTGSLTFGSGNPHYPQGTAMGMLSSSYKEGSDVWDTTFGPGYLDLLHQGSDGSYMLQFNLGQFYVSGPRGVFRVDLDNGEVYVSGLSIRLANPLSIGNGGTGATTPALIVTNQYVSILEAINEVRESRVFPISLQKNGTRYYGDMPSGYEQAEWNMELVGDAERLTAFLFLYGNTGVYKRDFFNGSWLTGWTKIASLTPADIGAVSTSAVIDVAHGGTGATTSAVTITNNYSSVLNAINAVKNTRIFPISIQKNGGSTYYDMPTGYEAYEWNMLLVGDSTRLTATLYIYSGGQKVFIRDLFSGSGNGLWISNWAQVV